jgi:hypothetical protein
VILLYTKEAKHGPLLCVGLLPENIRRMKEGDPIFVRLRDRVPELPDWKLFIGHNCKAREDDQKLINCCFHDNSLDRFVRRRLWDIRKEDSLLPFNLMLFYAEDENKFMADLLEGGINIEHFHDQRGGAN